MFTLPPDPYKALGLSRDAQLPEIRTAYRKLVLRCHPDKVQDPQLKAEKQEEFQRVHEAYELLTDEVARSKYDEKVRYNEKYKELEKEKEKARMSGSSPSHARPSSRTRHSYFEPEIRAAEPRPSTFAKAGTSPSSAKFYSAGYSSSRSWEDELGLGARAAYEEMRRSKKPATYERERDRDREQRDRERDREREWEHERERERERDRRKRKEKEAEERVRQEVKAAKEAKEIAKEAEEARKKKERRDKDKDKKKADKERKKEAEDKHRRHKSSYVEPYHEDSDPATPLPEKKSSSSRKLDETVHEIPRTAPRTSDRERKNSDLLDSAIRYLERSGSQMPSLSRSPTFTDQVSFRHVAGAPAVPTPPPAAPAVHPPPPPTRDIEVEEETPKRSSAKSSRHAPPDSLRSREKASHKKSGSRSTSKARVVDVSPTRVAPPPLHKSYSDSHRVIHPNRSYTESYPRAPPQPMPVLGRADSWHPGGDRGRGRGRHQASFSEGDSEEDAHYTRPSRRAQSPAEIVTTERRYSVAPDGKTRKHHETVSSSKSHKAKHAAANTSAPRTEPRSAYTDANGYETEPPKSQQGFKVKYAPTYAENDVQFSNVAYSSTYPRESYATPAY
ncbi:hypothetical protein DL770_007722 [Monosporascus sp. CRB-9-2]|nr:hypothetical protein DL770_007722 [Monosporascus sp. CRB-9-2]